jgi:hypothetical protein
MNKIIEPVCAFCGKVITEKRRFKYCSDKCRNKIRYNNNKETHNKNTYESQKERAITRKLKLIEFLGGKCSMCNYNTNIAALEFHHNNPNLKSIKMDSRKISNTKWESLLEEIKLCTLLCANCHRDLHNPDTRNLL